MVVRLSDDNGFRGCVIMTIASASGYDEFPWKRNRDKTETARRSGRVYARRVRSRKERERETTLIYISRRDRFHDRYWKDIARRGENRATWPAGTSETGGNSDRITGPGPGERTRCSKHIYPGKRNSSRINSGTRGKRLN